MNGLTFGRLLEAVGEQVICSSCQESFKPAGLANHKAIKHAPTSMPAEATAAAAEAVSGSFDDIRSAVQDAICDRIEALTGAECPWCWMDDIGPDWVVYCVGDGNDLFKATYSIDTAGVVTVGDPFEVTKVTTYVPDSTDMVTESVSQEGRLLASTGADAGGSRIFTVQLIGYGTSKNGTHYTESVMRAAAPLYEGAKAYDHHRTQAEINTSTVAGLVGSYKNVTATSLGLEAELHVLPSAAHIAEALDMSLANQSQGLQPLVGISHDVYANWKQSAIDGRTVKEAVKILSVNSADVIADPSAGGKALRMVAGGPGDPNPPIPTTKEYNVTLKQLLELLRAAESAKRPALLQEHAHLIESFGLTVDDVSRLSEAVQAPTPTGGTAPVRTIEATNHVKGSALGDLVIDRAIEKAKLDPARLREAISGDLGDTFTDVDLGNAVGRAARLAEAAGLAPQITHVDVTKDVRDKQVEALDQMLDPRNAGGYRSLRHAFLDISGAKESSIFDSDFNHVLLRECLNAGTRHGERVNFDSELRGTESVTSSTFGYILGDSITRRMIAEYQQPNLQTWRAIVSSVVPVSDFRTQKIDAMGGYGTLPAVNQGATYNPLSTPGNEETTYALTKRGGTEDLTLETIANDDLRMVQRIPQKLGLAAAQTLYRFVWDFIVTNATITRDSTALFAAGHNNTTSTTLSSTALEATRVKLRKQAAYGDTADILSLIPKYLITVPELEALAWQLCTSAVAIPSGAPVGAASNQPNLHQGMIPLIVDYWSATSTSNWFVVADPMMAPTIELGFFNGQQDPALFVQSDPTTGSAFTTDKVTYKIRHIYSGAVLDFRAFQRGNV